MTRSLTTRLLHALLALAILHQLLVSLVMEEPHSGRVTDDLGFELHETVGLASLAILALYWLWTAVRRREHPIGAVVPWFSASRRRALMADAGVHLKSLARLRLPAPNDDTPLASAVHGLGLVVASVMALTGGVIWLSTDAQGAMTVAGKAAEELHELFSTLMWIYLIGHAGLALLHEAAGHPVLRRMNPVARGDA